MLPLTDSLRLWIPELVLSVGAMAVVLAGVFARRARTATGLAGLTLGLAGVSLWCARGLPPAEAFSDLIIMDPLSLVFRWLALGVTALVMLMAAGASDVDGRAVWQWLRERRPALAGRVVFMTGDTMSAETQRFLQDSGRPILTKPLTIDRVRAVVDDVLALRG
jgi:CheY-like chemotaxis protein